MKVGTRRFVRLSVSLGATGILVVMLTACTGRGGGTLAPDLEFKGQAAFGFSFSCERSSNSTSLNPKPGRLRIELSYTDHGANPLGAGFSIHGTVDNVDPLVESAFCIGQDPPPGGNELIFLGRFRPTSSVPALFPSSCPTSETATAPLCRFQVIVRDNDGNLSPTARDFFSISLSGSTALVSEFEPATVFYARAGDLQGGNLTVD